MDMSLDKGEENLIIPYNITNPYFQYPPFCYLPKANPVARPRVKVKISSLFFCRKLTAPALEWCREVGARVGAEAEVDDILRGPDPACMAAIQVGKGLFNT